MGHGPEGKGGSAGRAVSVGMGAPGTQGIQAEVLLDKAQGRHIAGVLWRGAVGVQGQGGRPRGEAETGWDSGSGALSTALRTGPSPLRDEGLLSAVGRVACQSTSSCMPAPAHTEDTGHGVAPARGH